MRTRPDGRSVALGPAIPGSIPGHGFICHLNRGRVPCKTIARGLHKVGEEVHCKSELIYCFKRFTFVIFQRNGASFDQNELFFHLRRLVTHAQS